jgi:precorrin-3B synthase
VRARVPVASVVACDDHDPSVRTDRAATVVSAVVPAQRQSADDACPGALRLHAAADGPLARVRLPGGRLTGVQLGVLAEVADRWGDGALELTSRANVQLRGLRATGEELATRLAAAGLLPSLAHETVRNIAAPPLADPPTRALVEALDRRLCADPGLAALPGRFLFAIGRTTLSADVAAVPADAGAVTAFPSAAAVTALPADAAAVTALPADAAAPHPSASSRTTPPADAAALPADAAAPSDAAGWWTILLAGVDFGLRVATAEVVDTVLAAAHAFLAEQADHPAKPWRLREIPDGPALVARRLIPDRPVPRGHPDRSDAAPEPPAPLIGVLSDPRSPEVAVGALVPLGRLTGVQLRVLAEADRLVVTPWGGVVVPDLTPEAAPAWLRELRAAGLATDPGSKWLGVTTCAGRPGCGKALADVRADASTTARFVDGVPVHWVGCARGCGTPAGAHVRVEATADGYLVGGRAVAREELGEVVAAARRA